MAKKLNLMIQVFDRDEDGFNENEEVFDENLTVANIDETLVEASRWLNERKYKAGDISGIACVLMSGAQTNQYFSFNSAEKFEQGKEKIKELLNFI